MSETGQNTAYQRQPASRNRVTLAICVMLAAMVWVIYGHTLGHGFVNFDDNKYVSDKPMVSRGLTMEGIAWAFTHTQAGNWAPLITISHMLDCSIYGLKPWGHHLTNVMLHGAAAIMLFLVLMQMTGALWRSAFVAAVFAVHPLRVESVAWVSERKDVVSGVLFLLTIAAYVRYARNPRSLPRYLTTLLLFAAGLLAKAMLVTLPFVLLLLDYWPLGRLAQAASGAAGAASSPLTQVDPSMARRLALEKAPFFALSVAAAVAEVIANQAGIVPVKTLPPFARIANAMVSYVVYMKQMIYPAGLAVMYPHPGTNLPAWQALLACLLLASISAGAFAGRHRHPYLLVGWLWYLGMLVPVIGLVQAGLQAHADRYTYLPQIGLYVLLSWSVADLCAGIPFRHPALFGLSSVVITALMLCARAQVAYWMNSRTLWSRAVAVTANNAIAQNNLGYTLLHGGEMDDAIVHFQKALEINPDFAEAHYNLGLALKRLGNQAGAIAQFEKAIRLRPDYASAHYDLGLAFQQNGQPAKAVVQYKMALGTTPTMLDAHLNLGNILGEEGDLKDAVAEFQRVLEIKPDYAKARYDLGLAYQKSGRAAGAVAQYEKAIQIDPGNTAAMNNLAYVIATCPQASIRNGVRALMLARRVCNATKGNDPAVLGTMAAAYAENGQFNDAIDTAQQATALADRQANAALADKLRSQLRLYQAHTPLRDSSLASGRSNP